MENLRAKSVRQSEYLIGLWRSVGAAGLQSELTARDTLARFAYLTGPC